MKTIRIYPQSLYMAGIKENCAEYVMSFGMEIVKAGCVYNDTWFFKVKNAPETLPEHIELSDWTFTEQ